MNKHITKKLALALSMGLFLGAGFFITYAANLTSISSTYGTGDTLSVTWFNDLKSKISNIYGSGGNVGIGTSNPSAKLDVAGTIHIGSNTNSIIPDVNVNGNARTLRFDNSTSASTDGFQFYNSNSGTNLMMIQQSGNVGIGTTSPNFKLDVNGETRVSGNLTLRNTGPIIFLRDTDTRSAMIYNNSNLLYFLRGTGPDSINWDQYNGYWPLYLNLENNDAIFGGTVYAVNGYVTSSDEKLKTNISKIQNPIEKIKQLNGYTFDWKKDGKHDVGVIAQEVEKVFPELVSENTNAKGETYKAVKYSNLVAPLIEAVKEQQKEIEELKNRVSELEINNIENR